MDEPRPFRPSRKLGQNFLIDRAIAERIVRIAEIGPGDSVVDIGAGKGALVRPALQDPSRPRVIAVEIDRRLAETLNDELGAEDRFRLVRGDILKTAPEQLFGTDSRHNVVLTNAPYSISGALLRWLMSAAPRIDRAVAMFQSEVIDRVLADPGVKAYGLLTLACRLHFRIERCFQVHAGAFRPRPKVASTVIKLIPHPAPPVEVADARLLMTVARAAFAQRRKTLRNCLLAGAATLPGGRGAVDPALESAGGDPGARAETLDLEDFARLADGFR